MWNSIKQEPVLFQGLIQAVLALGVSFGLHLSGDQVGAILAVTAALLSVATRAQVTPMVNPRTNSGISLVPSR
jgi:hypothetical protein